MREQKPRIAKLSHICSPHGFQAYDSITSSADVLRDWGPIAHICMQMSNSGSKEESVVQAWMKVQPFRIKRHNQLNDRQ